jgi:hypothetical protein
MESTNLIVVGFNGRPVAGQAGLKPVLVFNQETQRYSIQNSTTSSYTKQEILDYEHQALLTIVDLHVPFCKNITALYAHADYIKLNNVDIQHLVFYPNIQSYIGFFEYSKALSMFNSWERT